MDTLCFRERWGLGSTRNQDKGLEVDKRRGEGYIKLRNLNKVSLRRWDWRAEAWGEQDRQLSFGEERNSKCRGPGVKVKRTVWMELSGDEVRVKEGWKWEDSECYYTRAAWEILGMMEPWLHQHQYPDCDIVLQDVTTGRKWTRVMWDHSVLFLATGCESTITWKLKVSFFSK